MPPRFAPRRVAPKFVAKFTDPLLCATVYAPLGWHSAHVIVYPVLLFTCTSWLPVAIQSAVAVDWSPGRIVESAAPLYAWQL